MELIGFACESKTKFVVIILSSRLFLQFVFTFLRENKSVTEYNENKSTQPHKT